MAENCEHNTMVASVSVANLTDSGRHMAHMELKCKDCGEPFRFLGLPMGTNFGGATVSPDGLEVRLAVAPSSIVASPIDIAAAGATTVN